MKSCVIFLNIEKGLGDVNYPARESPSIPANGVKICCSSRFASMFFLASFCTNQLSYQVI